MSETSPIKTVHHLTGRAGGYAISTVKSRRWISEPTSAPVAKPKRSKAVIVVVHQIFADCAHICADPYWARVFEQASLDKFPRKFSCRANQLHYKRGQKITSIPLPDSLAEAYQISLDFFRRYGGLYSEEDLDKARKQRELLDQNESSPTTWTEVRKKMRRIMLENFIRQVERLYTLSLEEKHQLTETINLGLMFGRFGKANIVVKDRAIEAIHGLCYDESTRRFSIDPSIPARPNKSSRSKSVKSSQEKIADGRKDTEVRFYRNWVKYVGQLPPTAAMFAPSNKPIKLVVRQPSTSPRIRLVPATASQANASLTSQI